MLGGGLWRLEAACYRAVIAVEEEGEPKDPVVEAAFDQGLGDSEVRPWRTHSISTFYTQEGSLPCDEQDNDCDLMLFNCHVHHDCVNGGRSVRTISGTLENRVRVAISCTYLFLPARSQLWSVSSDAVYHPELRIR